MASYTTFVNDLHANTGLNLDVLTRWAQYENGGNNNVLGVTSSSAVTASNPHGLLSFSSPSAGAAATAALLKSYYPDIMATAGGTSQQQALAISNSRWNTGSSSGSAWYRNTVFASFIGSASSTPSTPSGGASTPIAAVATSANPATSTSLADIPNGSTITANTVATIVKDIQALPGGTGQYSLSGSTLTTIVSKYIGKPWNSDTQVNISKDVQNAIPANSPLNTALATNPFLGAASTVAGAVSGGIPDVQTALVFIGVIIVAVVFIGSGAIITLRKK